MCCYVFIQIYLSKTKKTKKKPEEITKIGIIKSFSIMDLMEIAFAKKKCLPFNKRPVNTHTHIQLNCIRLFQIIQFEIQEN